MLLSVSRWVCSCRTKGLPVSVTDTIHQIGYASQTKSRCTSYGMFLLFEMCDNSQPFSFNHSYAREVMQLETIGLDQLNMDGTLKRDSRGNTIPTYDTNDILTFARAWTGFNIGIRYV